MSRRNFLKGMSSAAAAGLFYSALGDELVNALAFDFVSKASASTTDPIKNFVHYHLGGGPNRFHFDQFFALNETERLVIANSGTQYSHHLGSHYRIVDGRYAGTDFNLIPSHGILVPPIWDVVTGEGSKGKDALLNNWITFRGYKMASDGHQECTEAQTRPSLGKPSFNGAFLDRYASTELSGILDSSGYWMVAKYKSMRSIVANSASIDSDVRRAYGNIFGPFKGSSTVKKNMEGFLGKGPGSNQEKFDNLARVLSTLNVTGRADSSQFRQGVAASRSLVKRIEESLEADLLNIAQKYQAAVDRSYNAVIPGVSDKEFLMPLAPKSSEPDFRLHFQPGSGNSEPNRASDSCNLVKNYWASKKDSTSLVARFAVAEFLLKHKFVNHIMLNQNEGSFIYSNLIDNRDGSKMNISVSHDSHERGCGLALITESYAYLALMTCLQIFRKSMIEFNIFDDTLIQISSEFARTPRRDGSGSDHGGSNCILTSVLSGAIKNGPLVIGNAVEAKQNLGSDHAVNNCAAGVIFEIGKVPSPLDVTHSIGDLLGFKVPWATNSDSLIRVEGNGNISSIHAGGRHGRLIRV